MNIIDAMMRDDDMRECVNITGIVIYSDNVRGF